MFFISHCVAKPTCEPMDAVTVVIDFETFVVLWAASQLTIEVELCRFVLAIYH